MTKNKFSWWNLKRLGFLGLIGTFWLPEFKLFYLFFTLVFIEAYLKYKTSQPTEKNLNRYYSTVILSQFNIFLFPLILQQACGQLVIFLKNLKGFPNRENYTNSAKYILPFKGRWKVANGGSIKDNSHSWDIFTQRYAYDFVMTDSNDISYNDKGLKLNDYYCFGQEILSPADGTVVKVNNEIKDYTQLGDYSIDWRVRDFRGNFIIIKHHDKEFSFIAHFKKDSIKVQVGDKVKEGQIIGLCGNSGHSTEPHIHFHLQDSAVFWTATGLPIRFKEFKAESLKNQPTVKGNDFIEKYETVVNA